MLTRIKVVLKALPTYLVAASTAIAIFSEEIVNVLPDAISGDVAQATLVVIAWLTAAINIIRRVEPVIPERIGLLDNPVGH